MDDVVLIISVQAAAGRRAELVGALEAILPETRAFDGSKSVQLLTSSADADGVVLIERWSSMDHYEAYKAWRAHSGTSVLGSDLVAAAPTTIIARPT